VRLDSGDDVVILEGTGVEVSHHEQRPAQEIRRRRPRQVQDAVDHNSGRNRALQGPALAWTQKQFPKNATSLAAELGSF